MKPRELALPADEPLSLGDLSLEALEASPLSGGASPLSLLSPNAGMRLASHARTKPAAAKPAAAAAPTQPPTGGDVALPDEENEGLGALPRFESRRRGGRPDARRQSLALGAAFAGLAGGAGLLGDGELAVGDEEIQVPLSKSGKLLGGTANHSSLFCDPDTGDLLDTELPSPQFPTAGGGAAGASAPTPVAGARCESPVLSSALRGPASTRRTPAMRASMAVFGDLRHACEGQGLDDFDGADFQMQESNKVKELAFLFKMDDAAAGTPRSSIDASAMAAAKPDAGNLLRSSSSDLAGIRQRLEQSGAGKAGTAQQQEQQQTAQQPALQQHQQQDPVLAQPQRVAQAAPSSARPPVAPSPARPRIAPSPARQPVASSPARPRIAPSPARPPVAPKPAAAAALPAAARPATSRLPAPPARTSRLRPPTTSSGYFSSAASGSAGNNSRQPAARPGTAPAPAPARPLAAASRPGVRPTAGAGSRLGPAAAARPAPAKPTAAAAAARPAPAKPAAAAAAARPEPAKPAAAAAAAKPAPAKPAAAAAASAAATVKAPAAARLAQGPSRIPTPSKPAAPVPALSPLAMARVAAASSVSPANLTPNTARLRWLEQNPDLAFGGGTKLADSPADGGSAQPARKLTAEERHLMEWQDHL